jgi:hypothetical protein
MCGIDDRPRDAFTRGAFVAEGTAALHDFGPRAIEGVAEKSCLLRAKSVERSSGPASG